LESARSVYQIPVMRTVKPGSAVRSCAATRPAHIIDATVREVSMKRIAKVFGCLAAVLQFGLIAAFYVAIASKLLRLPFDLEPG
jgi:hypothetical protein